MVDVAVPSIATVNPNAGDTVLGVQGGAVRRIPVGTGSGLALEADFANASDPAKGAALIGHSPSGLNGSAPSNVGNELPVTVNARRYGIIPGATDLENKFADAFADLSSSGGRLILAPGVYEGNITFGSTNVIVDGLVMPRFDGSGLVGGTILRGQINLNDKAGVGVCNLGIDQRTLANTVLDAIKQGSVGGTSKIGQHLENIAMVGRGAAASSDHAILINRHPGVLLRNVRAYRYFHGVALKQGAVRAEGIYSYDCEGSTLIIKSDALDSNADVADVNVIGVVGECSGSVPLAVASIVVQSVNAAYKTHGINIANATLRNHLATTTYPITVQQLAGETSGISFTNVYVDGCAADRGFAFLGGSKISVVNGHGKNVQGHTFRNTSASLVTLTDCYSTTPSAGDSAGTFAKAEINGAPLMLKVTGTPESTSGGFEASANGNNGEMRIYRYSGAPNLFYAWRMISNGQGVRFQGATAAAAKGAESYTVNGPEFDLSGNFKTYAAVVDANARYPAQASGTTLTLADNVSLYVIDPTTDPIATLTINMPVNPVDGQRLRIASAKGITSITHGGSGKALLSPLASLASGQGGEWVYRASNTTWYRIS